MTRERAHSAWKSAEAIKTISDRVIGIGPFGVGLDGLLTWVPVAGTVYSVGGAVFLLFEALRAGAGFATILRMLAYLLVDSGASAVPVLGSAVDLLWQGHLMAATALQKDIEDRHGAPDDVPEKKRARKKGPSKFAH
jgi:hypothetical protein